MSTSCFTLLSGIGFSHSIFSDVLHCPDFTALKKELLQLQGLYLGCHSMKLLGESVVPLHYSPV